MTTDRLRAIAKKYKSAIFLSLFAIFLAAFLVNRCDTDIQDDATVVDAISQHQIEYLQAANQALNEQIIGYKATQDSLLLNITRLKKELVQKEMQRAEIALKYAKEKARVKKLPNDSAVGYFLDRADCSECPILKYDSSYLVEIDPIRFYNDLAVGFDEQVAINASLRCENDIQRIVIGDLTGLCISKDQQIAALNSINSNHVLVDSEKDVRIEAWRSKYKAEQRRHIVTKIVGGAVIAFGAVLLVAGL